jgi:hypothetical protein
MGKYLSDNKLSREMAYALYRAFNGEHFAWHLAEYLNQFFVQQPEKKQEYLAHLGGEPFIGIPSALQALSNQ